MRSIWLIMMLVILTSNYSFAQEVATEEATSIFSIDGYLSDEEEAVVKERLKNIESIVNVKFTTAVKGYILGYTERNRSKSERLLGRFARYFPLFEKKLAENEMPDDLKYLAVVESALDPKAISRVGAGGLWQFMPETGASYGLQITTEKDDRFDPEKSTDAAIQYLRKAYERFDSWELALAAYNSGGGRVNRAIKRARSKNFWKIQRYLPRETRNYVPAFIGATYLAKFYHEHELKPKQLLLDMQLTQTIDYFGSISFYTLSQITGVDQWIIEELNPSFKLGYIPYTPAGHKLTLPKRVMPAMIDYINKDRADYIAQEVNSFQSMNPQAKPTVINHPDDHYFMSLFTVGEQEHIYDVADIFGCSVYNIMSWNDLPMPYAPPGKDLKIFMPYEYKRYQPYQPNKIEVLELLPQKDMSELLQEQEQKEVLTVELIGSAPYRQGKYLYYRLRRYETLMDIADRYPEVSLQDIILLNNIDINKLPQPGTRIKLKKVK